MDFQTMVGLQLMLFLLILAGVYAQKRGILNEQAQKMLSDLLIGVILPCNIVSSFHIELTPRLLYESGLVLVVAFGAQVLFLLFSRIFYFKTERRRQMVLRYATICSNAGFLGLPLAGSIFGAEGTLYASIALIPLRVFMWSSGLSLFTKTSAKSTFKTLITHPCIIAVFVGFGVLFMPWELPTFLAKAVDSIGGCTIPVSMIIIGSILAGVNIKKVVSFVSLYFSFIRLILIPVALYGILVLLPVPPLVTGVTVLLAAMPAGSTTAILAARYDGDAEFASALVFVSTLLSLVTIPLLAFALF